VIKVYSYRWVPPVVRGVVRDVRVRWALEEIGVPYENVLIGPAEQKSDEYRAIQPFGQVPALVEDELKLSESGAIVHYLAQKSEKLMPKEPAAQARVTSWMFAALNSVEPFVQQWQLDVFFAKEDPKAAPKPRLLELVGSRLDALVPKLEGREYLEDRFTAADILMGSVMRMLFDTEFIKSRPVLLAYRKRCEARPAFKKALADHLASFDDSLGPKEMPRSS
jgi:glutathione S-transferase